MNGSPTLTVASDMRDLWHSNKEKGVCQQVVEFDGSPTCQFSLGRQILVLPLPQRRSQIDIMLLGRTVID